MQKSKEKGVVLVIVLLVMAAAMVLVLENGKLLRLDYADVAHERTMVAGGGLLRSGLDVVKSALLEDLRVNGDRADHQFDEWANIEKRFETYTESLQSGDLSGNVSAEDGRISLNALSDEYIGVSLGKVFVRLLKSLCKAHGIEADPNLFLASIKVWLGSTDNPQDMEWYAAQNPAYAPKRGPLQSPAELLLIRWKGVSPEFKRTLFYGTKDVPGLRDYVTVWGTGRININLASTEVLAALVPDSDHREEFVLEAQRYRSDGAHLLSGQWYNEIAKQLNLNLNTFSSDVLDVRSTVFRAQLTASIGAATLNSTTILKRDNSNCSVLFQSIH